VTDTAQIPACKIPGCVNEQATVGHRGLETIPHPMRDTCAAPEWIKHMAVRPLRDDPITENEDGGKQSIIESTFTTLPLTALRRIAKLQALGDAKYGAHNWRSIPEHEHINHAFEHLLLHCTGDRSDDHLLHAAWRLFAADEVRATRSTTYEEDDDD
jgi:hypothetical protein